MGTSLVLLVTTMAAGASPSGGAGAEATRSGQAASSGEEFVVSFDTAQQDAAMAAVADAGGTVLDVAEAVGVALVSASSDAFVDEVRSSGAISGVASNHSVGTTRPGMPHRYVEERPAPAERAAAPRGRARPPRGNRLSDPLAGLQWDMKMIGATADAAWRRATGRGVLVGVIDTGVDASHPDLAPNFSHELSRNFTMDIPGIDGPCEYETCIDPADVDHGGHGTHVAGTIAAARNGIGIAGVAPDATIVNLRAGQDSGYFFLYETLAALTEAGDLGLDVVNMSYYTDPWLYNCESVDDYISGTVSEEEINQQAFTRSTILAALDYATARGVTLVGSAGNGHTDLAEPERFDDSSPDYPEGAAHDRVVTDNCLDLPGEGPDVLSVSSVGPSGIKADYSNYGFGDVEVAAPGGWFRDGVGTPTYGTPGNLILSTYPLELAIEEGLADENGVPVDDFSHLSCDANGTCGFYTTLQGTSMAAPHVTGVAALVVEAHGRGNPRSGYALDPATVRSIILATAVDHPCPVGGTEIYTDEGRPPAYNAECDGTTSNNGLYGEGIVSAAAAVRR